MRLRLCSVLTAALTLAGCGASKVPTEDAAVVICDLLFSCHCKYLKYADVEECVRDQHAERDAWIAEAKQIAAASGLIFDQACADSTKEYPVDLACDPIFDPCSYCAAVHGQQPEGAPCVRTGDYSDCAAGLFCYPSGRCIDMCDVKRLGEGEACGNMGIRCDEGLFCDSSSGLVCKPTVGVGGSCTHGQTCSDRLYCKQSQSCQPLPGAGEPCGGGGECLEDLYCARDSKCRFIPRENQACDSRCADELNCEAGFCKPRPGHDEPCSEFGPCAGNLACDPATNLCPGDMGRICMLGEPD